MADYQKMYTTLFNAITDAREAMNENQFCKATEILLLAQQQTEEIYVKGGQ